MNGQPDNISNTDAVQTLTHLEQSFRDSINSGDKLSIEDVLQSAGDHATEVFFRTLLQIELDARIQAGRTPELEEYQSRFSSLSYGEAAVLAVFEDIECIVSTNHSEQSDSTIIKSSVSPISNTLDRYEIRETLGQGGFGTVYRAWDPRLEREVALKVPHPHLLASPEIRQRFLREARAVSALRHSGICPIYEIHDLPDGTLLLSMAYIPGASLARYLAEHKPLAEDEAIQLIKKIAFALQQAHSQGVLHRDLKPANILLAKPDNHPVVTDFGLARRTHSQDATLTNEGDLLGTPAYMSPEQARGDIDRLTEASDIYSLGVVLYEMLTGQRPFSGSTTTVLAQVLRDEPKRPTECRPTLDPRLEQICLKAMSKAPENRYSQMSDFVEALQAIPRKPKGTNEKQAGITSTPLLKGAAQRSKLTRHLITASLLLISAVTSIALIMMDGSPAKETKNQNEVQPAEQSPFVGTWRIYSARYLPGGGSLEILPTGEAKLTLDTPQQLEANRIEPRRPIPEILSQLKSFDSSARNVSFTAIPLEEESSDPPLDQESPPEPGPPDLPRPEIEQSRVRMTYQELTADSRRTLPFNHIFQIDAMSHVRINWEIEHEDEFETFPFTSLSLYPEEEWQLSFTDENHVISTRSRMVPGQLDAEKNPMQVMFDSLTLIRDRGSQERPLPPQHWLLERAYYSGSVPGGKIGYVFYPDGQLFVGIDRDDLIGGRLGRGGLRLTYRLLELTDEEAKLEVRSGPIDPADATKKYWDTVSFSPREIWVCREWTDQNNKWKNLGAIINRERNLLEQRTRFVTVYVEVDGKQVPESREETYLVEVPVIESIEFSSTPK